MRHQRRMVGSLALLFDSVKTPATRATMRVAGGGRCRYCSGRAWSTARAGLPPRSSSREGVVAVRDEGSRLAGGPPLEIEILNT